MAKNIRDEVMKKAQDRLAGKTQKTTTNTALRQSVLEKAKERMQPVKTDEPQKIDRTRQKALEMVQNSLRKKQEAKNFELNMGAIGRDVNRGGMTVNPNRVNFERSAYDQIAENLGLKIENEENIINNQGRAEDDPYLLRAQETLGGLKQQQEELKQKQESLPQMTGEFTRIGYTPEEEAYIRRMQRKIERGQSKGGTVGFAYKPEVNYINHMRNTPATADSEDYIKWLEEGANIGLYDENALNAMMQQSGEATPYEQYKALDEEEKSSWGDYNPSKRLMGIYGLNSAWDYGENYKYGTDRGAQEEKLKYYTEARDRALGDLEKEKAGDTQEKRELNGKYRILAGEQPIPQVWEGSAPADEFLNIIRSGKKPEDYEEREGEYDAWMYDFIYGDGAWERDFVDGDEESSDLAYERINELWDRFDNGTIGQMAKESLANEYQSAADYYQDKINDVSSQLKKYEKYDNFLGQFEGIGGADYNPDIDRGRTTLWTYDDEYYDPNVPYASPYTNDVHRIYSFINKGKEYQAYLDFVAGGTADLAKISEAYGKTALMNSEMKRKFNELYEQKRYDEAGAFLEGLSMYLNDMYSDYEHIYAEEMARQMPVTSSAVALGAELLSGIMAPIRTAAGALGDESVQDPKSEWYRTTRYGEQTQQAIADMIGGEGGKIYLQGMNTLRNLMNVAAVSLLGVTGPAAAPAGLAMFATQIYQDSTYKYLKETNDYNKAVGYALLDAALETAEELLPYEAMLSGGSNIFVNWLANSLSEAMEELTGATVGEAIKAQVIDGGRNEWMKRRDQIFNEGGYTDENGAWVELEKEDRQQALADAQKQALKEYGQQVIDNTLAGFVGGGLGGVYGVVNSYNITKNTGRQIRTGVNTEGTDGTNRLIEAARGMNEKTASRKMAERMFDQIQKGKEVSNYQVGKLTETMARESSEEVQEIVTGALTRRIEGELREYEADENYIEQAAPVIAEGIAAGGVMNRAEISIIAQDEAGVKLMESYLASGNEKTQEVIEEAGGKGAMEAQRAIRDVMGENQRNAKVTKQVEERLLKYAPVATQEEITQAEQEGRGHRTESGMDAIVDGEIVQIVGRTGDQYTVLDENNKERTVSKNDVKAADEKLGILMEYADRNRGVISDETFREMALEMKNNPDMGVGEYINRAVNAYLNYKTGGEVKAGTLAESTLNVLKTHAQQMNKKYDTTERLAKVKQYKAEPGKGEVTYKGAKAGTEEYDKAAEAAGPMKAEQIRLLGELGTRIGNRFVIEEREDLPDTFGWEDETGTIHVNIAAENVRTKEGTGMNRHVLTVAAHELTHFLEQNSPEQYVALRDFVFSSLRKQGVDVAGRISKKIANFRAVTNRDMNVDEAMAEIVADACDNVLTSEKVIRQIEEETPNLYKQVKKFVKDFFNTVMQKTRGKNGKANIDTSFESRMMNQGGQEVMDELSRLWLGARQEAMERTQQAEGQEELTEAQIEKMSTRELDDVYMQAVENGDMETAQKIVDQAAENAGYTIHAYHGTGRADRVGTVFRADRATSGPMAFFTDNKQIAENYSRNKQDTSISYDDEYGDYHNQFRIKLKNGKEAPISKYWYDIPFAERQKITERARHITLDDEADEIIYDESAERGVGNFDEYTRKRWKYNSIEALIDGWLDGGVLWDREGDFLKVLELAGINGVKYNDPNARYEKVYDTYLKIQNPFTVEDKYTNEFLDDLQKWWDGQENKGKYINDNYSADAWDKNGISVEKWIEYGRMDVQNDMTSNWTRIPDGVTAYLKKQGYDGIKDRGGKGGGAGHTVWIPFTSEQIKSAEPVVYDDDGSVIPPSERFNAEKQDIRFSVRDAEEMEINRWMEGLTEGSLRTEQERMLWRQYKGTQKSWEMTKHFIREMRNKQAEIEKKGVLSTKDKFDIANLEKRIEEMAKRRDEYENALMQSMAEEGYARIMYRERDRLENLANGRTEDEVRKTIDAIQAELDTVSKEISARNAKLKELAEKENVKKIRQALNSAGLKRIAAKLKDETGSELESREIENRLALMALKMKQGKTDASEYMELADMIIGGIRPYMDSYVLSELKGATIALNEAELKELKNRGMTVRDLQRELTGTGIRIVSNGPNTIDKNWDEWANVFPQLDKEPNPGDMLWGADPAGGRAGIMDLIESAMREQRQAGPSTEQIAGQVMDAVYELMPEILTDAKSQALIRDTMEFIAEINASTDLLDNMDNLLQRVKKKSAQAKATLGNLENQIVDAIEYNNVLAKQNDATSWRADRTAIIRRLRDEKTQGILKAQQEYREKLNRFKRARELTDDNNSVRREIHQDVQKIRKLLVNESDTKNVPERVKGLARYMVGMVVRNDLFGERKLTGIPKTDLLETARLVKAWNDRDGMFALDDLKEFTDEEVQTVIADALADIEEGIEDYDNKISNDLIENLTAYHTALEKVLDGVHKITGIIEAEQNVDILGRKRSVTVQAGRVIDYLNRAKRKDNWIGWGSKGLNATTRTLIFGNTTPVYFFKNLRNPGMDELWKGFEAAENRNGLLLNRAKNHMAELAKKYHYDTWDLEKKHEITLNGVKVPMTLENMMAMYATWNRELQTGPEESSHMATGGVYIEDEQKQKGLPRRENKEQRARRVKLDDMARIAEALTEEQKAYIADVVKYLSSDMSELGNEASMKMYGIRKYNEDYYFPMRVWDGVKSARSDRGISGVDDNRIAHQGWSKRRKHLARNALVIGKFTDTAVKHIEEMINYTTFAPVIEGMNKVLNWQESTFDDEGVMNNRNVRVMLQEAYGKETLRYLEEWMKDLQGGVTQDQRKTLRDRLISMFKKNAVAGSLSVTAQQPLSYIRAAMMISPKYLAGALSPQYWKGSYKEMMEHSGVAVIKQMGKFDMNFGQSARDWIMPGKKSAYEKFSDVLTAAPQAADTATWTRMWSAVKMEQHAKNPDMDITSEEFLDKVAERFNEVMRRTQVYDSVLSKSSNMRSQSLSMKLITSFMAEPTLSLNVLADALLNVNQKGGKTVLAKAGATYLLSAVLQAAVKGFMGAGRSPDEKKTAQENLLNKFLYNVMSEANPISLIPGYGDIVEVLKNGELKDDALGVLGKLKSIYTTAQNVITNPDKSKGPWRDVEDTIGQFIQLFSNVPMKNIMRDTRAMYNWATGRKFADRPTSGAVLKYQAAETLANTDSILGVINTWLGDAGYKSTNAAYYGRMYNAMKNGNQAEADEIKEYLTLGKGTTEDKIASGLRTEAKKDDSLTEAEQDAWMIENDLMDSTSTITKQYKDGKITAEEYKTLAKAANPKLTDDELYWMVDRADYQKEYGLEKAPGGEYYRLGPALETNKSAEITKAVNDLLEHGKTKENVKKQIGTELKTKYMEADSADKVKIRNEMQIAYKALGLTAKDADKTIDGWVKDANKKKSSGSTKTEVKDTTGRWGRGNIDLNKRQVVHNKDGSISTERSFSVNIDGKEVLLPTVINGKIVSEDEAIEHYKKTGEHLGKFNTVKEADEYAQKLHERQEWYYNGR